MAVHWRSLLLTVVPVMTWGWFVSAGMTSIRLFFIRFTYQSLHPDPTRISGLIVALFPSLTYQSALVISACLTPTDPILAAAIVGGHFADKNVSSRYNLHSHFLS